MKPHQLRVVEEYRQLIGRIDKLSTFVTTDLFAALPNSERTDMFTQLSAMSQYANALSRRIARFT